MAEQEQNRNSGVTYKQVLPAGVAPEVASGAAGRIGDCAAFGPWLRDRLAAASVPLERLAALSGVAPADVQALIDGYMTFPLDADHLQRFAGALTELHVVADPSEIWQAAGFADTEYIVPPSEIVQTMSGTV
jgi:hypothetical protein